MDRIGVDPILFSDYKEDYAGNAAERRLLSRTEASIFFPKRGGCKWRDAELVLRGRTWWLDFRHMGERHQVRLGRNISRTTAAELATGAGKNSKMRG